MGAQQKRETLDGSACGHWIRMSFFGIDVTLEPAEVPPGRRLEDIQSVGEVDPSEVDGWLGAIAEDARRADRRVSLVMLALCVPLYIGFQVLPEEWATRQLDIGRTIQGIGIFFMGIGVLSLLPQLRVRRWRRTDCRVVATSILRTERQWVPAVFYEYTVDGVPHRSHRLTQSGPTGNPEQADAARRRFRPGERRRCYVHPRRPDQAVLETAVSFRDAQWLAVLGLATLLLGSVWS